MSKIKSIEARWAALENYIDVPRIRQAIKDSAPSLEELELSSRQFTQKLIDHIRKPSSAKRWPCLKLISAGQKIEVPACDGSQNLCDSPYFFTSPDFEKRNLHYRGPATVSTLAEVHELIRPHADYKRIFGELHSEDLNQVCWQSQHQIKDFLLNFGEAWLEQDDIFLLFLFKQKKEYYVVNVEKQCRSSLFVVATVEKQWRHSFYVDVTKFQEEPFWQKSNKIRVVAPRIKSFDKLK